MKLVDTHQHLWNLARLPCSWTAGIPTLHRSFVLPQYLAAAKDCGIEKAVFMECDVDLPHHLDEVRWVEELAAEQPIIAGMVAGGRPEFEDFDLHLEHLQASPLVRGVRRVLHTEADETALQPLFVQNLRRLPARGYSFDLCLLARQLPVGTKLARQCPEVAFILDHCGIPDLKGGDLDAWRRDLRELAACDNLVACKVSGLVAYADPDRWTVGTLRPCFEHVVDCFGWDRLIWGGDWPVCTLAASLREWVMATRALVAEASETEQAKFHHLNAERIYRV
jgi:predicted TIM-barrel fold metal-dependent hydrolase